MSQSDSPPVLDPTQIDFPPEICAYLTTLLHQTLACTVELPSHVAQVSWDVQGQDVFRWRTIFAVMNAALDAYTDLVADRLAVLGRVAVEHGRHDDLVGEAASVSQRHSRG
jgi:DNA-binding ferritin-like protein